MLSNSFTKSLPIRCIDSGFKLPAYDFYDYVYLDSFSSLHERWRYAKFSMQNADFLNCEFS